MKRYTLILALVCMLFFGTGLNVSAYEVGDVIEGIEITSATSKLNDSFVYYLVSDSKLYLFDDVPYLKYISGSSYYLTYPGLYVNGTINDDNTVALSGYSTSSGKFSNPVSSSDFVASNFNLCDEDGTVVFPLPPVPDPTPDPEVPTTLMEAVQMGVTDLVLWIVKILATIFLGGILLVIWRPLFQMSRKLLRVLFRQ